MKSIYQKLYSGASTNLLTGLVLYPFNFLVSIFLMRLLGPQEFGIMAIVSIFISFFVLISDLGISDKLIQEESLSEKTLSSVFGYKILSALLIILIVFIIGSVIESYFEIPKLRQYLAIASVVILFNSVSSIPKIIATRNLNFSPLIKTQAVGLVLAGILSIVLAQADYGVYALMFRLIFPSFFLLALFFVIKHKYSINFNLTRVIPVVARSKYYSGVKLLRFFAQKTDSLVVGKLMGTMDLGIYDRSYNTMLMPMQQVKGKILQILFPVLSKIKNDTNASKKLVLAISKILIFITFPILILIFAFIPEIVDHIIGKQWVKIIPFVRAFCLLAFVQLPTFPGTIFKAQDDMKTQLYTDLFNKSVWIIAIVLGVYYYGLWGAVFGVAIGVFVNLIINNHFAGKLIELTLQDLFFALIKFYIFTALIIVCIQFLPLLKLSQNLHLILKTTICLIPILYFYIKELPPAVSLIKNS